MASASSQQRAKYKNMLLDWIVGICLVFIFHIIISFVLNLTSSLTGIFSDAALKQTTVTDGQYQADAILSELRNGFGNWNDGWPNGEGWGWDMLDIGYLLEFLALLILTLAFTFQYMKRLVMVSILVMIAPIMAMMYPLDKIKDGKAQAFSMWMKEFIFNCLLQVMHLILYITLLGNIQAFNHTSFLYGIIAYTMLLSTDQLLRSMFGLQSNSAVGAFSVAATAAGLSRMLTNGWKNSPYVRKARQSKEMKDRMELKRDSEKESENMEKENRNIIRQNTKQDDREIKQPESEEPFESNTVDNVSNESAVETAELTEGSGEAIDSSSVAGQANPGSTGGAGAEGGAGAGGAGGAAGVGGALLGGAVVIGNEIRKSIKIASAATKDVVDTINMGLVGDEQHGNMVEDSKEESTNINDKQVSNYKKEEYQDVNMKEKFRSNDKEQILQGIADEGKRNIKNDTIPSKLAKFYMKNEKGIKKGISAANTVTGGVFATAGLISQDIGPEDIIPTILAGKGISQGVSNKEGELLDNIAYKNLESEKAKLYSNEQYKEIQNDKKIHEFFKSQESIENAVQDFLDRKINDFNEIHRALRNGISAKQYSGYVQQGMEDINMMVMSNSLGITPEKYQQIKRNGEYTDSYIQRLIKTKYEYEDTDMLESEEEFVKIVRNSGNNLNEDEIKEIYRDIQQIR